MDQVRTILAWLKQHHFWVLTGLVALIALGCWWSAAGTLSAQYEANEQQITAQFNSLSTLRSNPFHPNEVINEKQITETKEQTASVAEIWEALYERQREDVLEWPPVLSEAFREHVEKLQFGGDIPARLRQNYQDYVERHFPELPEKIGARVMREGESSSYGGGGGEYRSRSSFPGEGGMGSPTGMDEDEGDYIVAWLDQAHVREELNFPLRPSAIRIWWTQENLWVYHTLLNVIRNTNEAAGATRMSNAAVRTIYSLLVGQPAAQFSRTKDRIYKLPTAAPVGGEMSPFGEVSPEGGGMEFSAEPGRSPMSFGEGGFGAAGGAMTPEQEAAMLLSGRYLGEDGRPIAGGMAAGGDEFSDPAAAPAPVDLSSFGREYKRLPVRMVLQMDQRWLPKLIAECASQPLQVEVQEVRINPPGGAAAEGMSGGGGYRGGFQGGGMSGSMFPDRTGLLTFPQQPNVVDVVIQGVIYIFNKPDPTVLESTAEPQTAAM
jgi:uncharacterized membrane protein YgcG